MSPVTVSAPRTSATPQPAMPGGFAGQILRVDLSKRRCWAEPWGSPAEMRDQLAASGRCAPLQETRKGRAKFLTTRTTG